MILTERDLMKKYLSYLKLERGLSQNTVEGYRNDVYKLLLYIGTENLTREILQSRYSTIYMRVTGYRNTSQITSPHIVRIKIVL